MTRTIIAMTGLAGSGKSAAARRLFLHHDFARVRFAGQLRKMLHAIGLTEEHTDGKLKEFPCDLLCGKTPRHAMQTIGTEWGRDLIGSDFWIRCWQAEVNKLPTDLPVVVDDCRFPNEATAIRAAGGLVVRVHRPYANTSAGGHVSESFVGGLSADYIISNHGTVDDLYREVDRAMHALQGLPIAREVAGFGEAISA